MKPIHAFNVLDLQKYIAAVTRLPKPARALETGRYPFITISRQTGAGGHTLAEAVVGEMEKQPDRGLFGGWRILDQELCHKVVTDPELKVTLESLLTEKFRKEIDEALAQIFTGASSQLAVYHRTAKLIRSFATLGKVIVVGRAASFITSDLPLGLHVRLVAPKAARIQTMMRQFNMSRDDAEREVLEQDASRALLVRTYFNGKDIDNALYYDAVWNTERTPIPEIAAFLANRVSSKAKLKNAAMTAA